MTLQQLETRAFAHGLVRYQSEENAAAWWVMRTAHYAQCPPLIRDYHGIWHVETASIGMNEVDALERLFLIADVRCM